MHPDVSPMFCPSTSTYQSIDYSQVVSQAVRSYPGAVSDMQALIFQSKHQQMSIENAKAAISKLLYVQDGRAAEIARLRAAMAAIELHGGSAETYDPVVSKICRDALEPK